VRIAETHPSQTANFSLGAHLGDLRLLRFALSFDETKKDRKMAKRNIMLTQGVALG
jgi:hypothetical protein